METGVINGTAWEIVKRYVPRRYSLAKIEENKIIIEISSRMNNAEQFEVFEKLKKRVMRKIERHKLSPIVKKKIMHGDVIALCGENYTIILNSEESKKYAHGYIKENFIHLFIPQDASSDQQQIHIRELVRKLISEKKLPELKRIVNNLNEQYFNAKIEDIKFKKQTNRWGSCSKKRNINISHRLLFAPSDVLTYVCAHELSHLIEFNHSKRFWELVEKAIPDYKEKEQWLKNNEHKLAW